MRILDIIYQNRRDFRAIFICEHCEYKEERSGYDDSNFHENVIPKMECKKCGKTAPETYRPQATKYPDDKQV